MKAEDHSLRRTGVVRFHLVLPTLPICLLLKTTLAYNPSKRIAANQRYNFKLLIHIIHKRP